MSKTITNFGGNVTFTPERIYQPRDEAQVLELLNKHGGGKVRVIGSLHSWSNLVPSEDTILEMSNFDQIEIETADNGAVEVSCGGGCVIQKLLDYLHRHTDYTLPTIGAIKLQTIAGAISTGTHGSGKQSLSHYMQEVRLAAYDSQTGEAKIYTWQDGEELQAARCALGCMGVILSVKFRCIPKYYVAETVARYETLEEVLAQEEEFPLQEFVLVPYLWQYFVYQRKVSEEPPTSIVQRWCTWFYRLYNFWGVDVFFHLIIKALISRWSNGKIIRWFYKRISPSFALLVENIVDDSEHALTREHQLFVHLEMEIFIPAKNFLGATTFVQQVIDWFAGTLETIPPSLASQLKEVQMLQTFMAYQGAYTHHYPLFFRRVLPDDTLISMTSAAQEPYYTMSFFSYQADKTQFKQLVDFLARALTELYQVRLHWGKYYPLNHREIAPLYPNLAEFRQLCLPVDSQGVFRNQYINKVLGFNSVVN